MGHLRNLGRRKLRTALTVLGITIGIWALVVFGSMANKISSLVAGGSMFYEGKVTVSAQGASMGFGSPLAISIADQVAELPGVDVVVPQVMMLMSDEMSGVSMSMPPMITGGVAGADQGRETFPVHYASGRRTARATRRQRHRPGLDRAAHDCGGDTITLRGEPFEVVASWCPRSRARHDGQRPARRGAALYIGTLPRCWPRAGGLDVATGLTSTRPGARLGAGRYCQRGGDPRLTTMTARTSIAAVGSAFFNSIWSASPHQPRRRGMSVINSLRGRSPIGRARSASSAPSAAAACGSCASW